MKTIKVSVENGGYCECGCKGRDDTRYLKITKGKTSKDIGIYADIERLLKELSKKEYFEFEIKIKE